MGRTEYSLHVYAGPLRGRQKQTGVREPWGRVSTTKREEKTKRKAGPCWESNPGHLQSRSPKASIVPLDYKADYPIPPCGPNQVSMLFCGQVEEIPKYRNKNIKLNQIKKRGRRRENNVRFVRTENRVVQCRGSKPHFMVTSPLFYVLHRHWHPTSLGDYLCMG